MEPESSYFQSLLMHKSCDQHVDFSLAEIFPCTLPLLTLVFDCSPGGLLVMCRSLVTHLYIIEKVSHLDQ